MASSTRVPHAEITGLYGAIVKRMSKKMLGEVPEPLGVMWHHKRVLKALFGFSAKAEKWDACDPQLKSFAHMAAASMVGCSFCLDLGYFKANNGKLDIDKAREVPQWRESDLFTPLERDVMEYAEAMSKTPPTVTSCRRGCWSSLERPGWWSSQRSSAQRSWCPATTSPSASDRRVSPRPAGWRPWRRRHGP